MAKITAKMNSEVAARPAPGSTAKLNKSSHSAPIIKKYYLLDQNENVVATLIDRGLAEKWISDGKMGAVKLVDTL